MLARVSSIETFRRWRMGDEATPEDLVERLTNFQPTEAMLAGTAFHAALEVATPGDYDRLESNGYTFLLPDSAIALTSIRELRVRKDYGQLTVTGKLDALHGKRVEDHKTTGTFNPDGYIEGCQWRFYLDMFEADLFRWNVFVITPVPKLEKTYNVKPPQLLEQYRYPGMHDDCMDLARDFHEFAAHFMPHHIPQLEAA
jgi:hypothetical protein